MAEKLHIRIGELYFRGEEPYVKVDEGQTGCVLYGPYENFPPNKYQVQFDVLTDEKFIRDGRNFCSVDVTQNFGKIILNKAEVNSMSASQDGLIRIVLPFEIDASAKLEFRFNSLGTHAFSVRYNRIATVADSTVDGLVNNPFYEKNLSQLLRYTYIGAKLTPRDDGVVLEWMGAKFIVKNVEDFQLIHEIFISGAYNFALSGEVCAIDVGMNVGLASLYFARRPEVRIVHAFEPFSRPFARALENFALNPELGSKIKPNNVGLAGASEALEVTSREDATIGSSIRGRGSSGTALETIRIQEASGALRPLIQEAVRNKQAVVFKMDCEGSEFAVIEALNRAYLLRSIDIFMIESHQWWSADKSNTTIVDSLLANGFFVFDFFNLNRPEASMIYAARGNTKVRPAVIRA